ncbi:3-oxoacyl-ACP reductase FabG [Ammoniphilus sp. CFH 90114]|uniref:3-oxoacyl-ACP reductase FabG n=1 Tax=Ammoniphilus sp. CFH 90114 TaxID=2493665 RepID=UPI00100FB3B4|nr:3-oxoacyl-ACP reductase FabG [Ammoniphilus sp. CFH 90114]RXT13518.1 3-oxoacyl-ACP reductase FabG [Ammoniphilus sp. CFH 90114]
MRLKDQVAVITGGGSGLGREASLLFAQAGATVAVCDVNKDQGIETVKQIQEQGGKAHFNLVDVGNQKQVAESMEQIHGQHGKIDILINNAGITRDAMIHKMSPEQWEQVIQINLTGVFNCTHAIVPFMRERGYGRIINTSSVVGVYGNMGQTNYAAAKAGVIAMTKTWAKELGPKGISVNAVAPGFIKTPMTAAVPEKILKLMEEKVPLKRLGEAQDIAQAYLFLASPEAAYINGCVLNVDGGLVL